MRRPWPHRLFSTLFTLWFALVGTGLVGLDACPTHRLAVPSAQTASHGASHGHEGMHGGQHLASAARGAATHHGDQSGQHAHQCTCPGSCCCSAPLVAAPRLAPVATVVSIVAEVPSAPEQDRQPAWLDFLLPFATAPPLVAV